jgi:hypothetical protein
MFAVIHGSPQPEKKKNLKIKELNKLIILIINKFQNAR